MGKIGILHIKIHVSRWLAIVLLALIFALAIVCFESRIVWGSDSSQFIQAIKTDIPNDSFDSFTIITGNSILSANMVVPSIKSDPLQLKVLGPTKKYILLPGDENPRNAGQCVLYVKWALGSNSKNYSGNAITWTRYINSDRPVLNSVVVLDTNRLGHVGIVVKITDDTITVRSRNWEGLWIISDNIVNRSDNRILGYIVP